MNTCEANQPLMLEYLYDLLEAPERQALAEHLAGCPACQAALAKEQGAQRLLSAAARMEFPNVRFERPAEVAVQPAPPPEPAVRTLLLAERPRLGRPRRGVRWAVAAAVLLAVAGLAIPAVRTGRDYVHAKNQIARHDEAVADARQRISKAEQELGEAARSRDTQIEEIRNALKARELKVVVTGPRSVESGAPTDYQVRTYDFNGQPAAARIVARVADEAAAATGVVSATPAKDGKDKDNARLSDTLPVQRVQDGLYRLTVPASLPLKPGRQFTLLVSARRDSGSQTELRERVNLTAPVYLTHLTTDKPMYQPGETVYFRSLTLDRFSLAPAREQFRFRYSLTTPTGEVRQVLAGSNALLGRLDKKPVLGPDGKPVLGVGSGAVELAGDAPGGEYTLTVSDELQRFPPQERKFTVNNYQKPALEKKLDFNRKTYGAGDEVQARCKAVRAATGRPVADCQVRVGVNVDGKTYDAVGNPSAGQFVARTDAEGQVTLRFKLPKVIERGQASVSVTFDDPGFVDTLVRTIPIILKKLDVELFPEGGYLVAGLSNRVYFQARTPLGKPAELKGRLLEDGKPLEVTAETLHDDEKPGVNQGMGKFAFTPKAGSTYALKIHSPAGIDKPVALPDVRADGVVMNTGGGVVETGQPIRVEVRSTRKRPLLVGAYCRGRLLDSVRLEEGQTEAVLRPTSGAGGVCRVTVFEELPGNGARRELKPVAERLVYRQPAERVDIDIRPDRRTYVPGQKVTLSLSATDEKEKLKPAVVMLAVVDRNVLTLADEKTARVMPTHFLLTTEVRQPEDLEYADFLLGGHPKAAAALDLLLGTQGWRRFAEQNPLEFLKRQQMQGHNIAAAERQRRQAEAERLMVMTGQSTPRQVDFEQEKIDKALAKFETRRQAVDAEREEASTALVAAQDDREHKAALATLATTQARLRLAQVAGAACLFLLSALGLAVGLARQGKRSVAFVGLGTACVALAAVLIALPFGGHGVLPHLEREQFANRKAAVPEAAHRRAWDEDANAAAKDKEKGPEELPAMIAGRRARPTGAMNKPGEVMPEGAAEVEKAQAHMKKAVADDEARKANRAALLLGKGGDKGAGEQKEAGKQDKGKGEAKDGAVQEKRLPAPAGALRGRRLEQAKGADRKAVARGDARREFAGKAKAGDFAPGRFARGMPAAGFGGRRGGPAGGPAGIPPPPGQPGAWAGDADGRLAYLPPLPPMEVREYAHRRDPKFPPELRQDFTETVFWHPVLVLPDGKAKVTFELGDSVTTFQAIAFAHTLDGRLGAGKQKVEVRLPFTLSPKLPLEVTAGDTIDVPLSVSNNTGQRRNVRLDLVRSEGLTLQGGQRNQNFDLPAESSLRKLYRFQPTLNNGKALLAFAGKADSFAGDSTSEAIRVVPEGFPVVGAYSDLLEGSATRAVELPRTWVAGTLKARVDVYPSTLADLQKGLDGLLREPNGCFEQTSTSNYPNLLILDYLKESNQANPEVERRARDLMARGYQKLTSFECTDPGQNKKRGYEWFGGTAPAHEALTAYGLMQFRDMARVQEVDRDMVRRTRTYLMAQRDGNGGFKRNPRALDTFGRAPDHVTNAYIVWALTEGGKDDDVTKELDALAERGKTSKDPYFLALVANALINRARTAEAVGLLKTVAGVQKDDGHLDALETSITGSGGRDLQIETTALAVLGWLKANPGEFNKPVQQAVRWIGQQRGGYGGFGSTQSTILALKALIAHTRANKKTPQAGELKLFVGETQVAAREFPAGASEVLTLELPEAEKHLKAGKNKLRVDITGKNVFPMTLSWSYQTLQPVSAEGCPVRLHTSLARREANEGDAVRLTVRLENVSGKGQGMAVAIVGLPGGMSLPEDLKQLKEYTRPPTDGKRPLLGAFEVRGRELVLYWRDLGPGEKVEVPVDLICRVPGSYRGPASRGYLYYNADKKHWVEPLQVTIAAKR
jgi:hypothetical protein